MTSQIHNSPYSNVIVGTPTVDCMTLSNKKFRSLMVISPTMSMRQIDCNVIVNVSRLQQLQIFISHQNSANLPVCPPLPVLTLLLSVCLFFLVLCLLFSVWLSFCVSCPPEALLEIVLGRWLPSWLLGGCSVLRSSAARGTGLSGTALLCCLGRLCAAKPAFMARSGVGISNFCASAAVDWKHWSHASNQIDQSYQHSGSVEMPAILYTVSGLANKQTFPLPWLCPDFSFPFPPWHPAS